MNVVSEVKKSAVLSEDGQYRYRLDRWWEDGQRLIFLMMNPSTADAEVDDPTIRKCMGFSRRGGFAGITVVNLFAFRSSNPLELLTAIVDPVGPENVRYIVDAMNEGVAAPAICAWGCESTLNKPGMRDLASKTLRRVSIATGRYRFFCLGRTKGGTPRHPLMLPYAAKIEGYSPEEL